MIVVWNKKSGTGASILSFSLSQVLNLPLYVKDNNYYVKSKEYDKNDPRHNIRVAGKANNKGVFDAGSNTKVEQVREWIELAKVVIIPLEFGYESKVKTLETIKEIRFLDNPPPIILVINRIQDDTTSFAYTRNLIEEFQEKGFIFDDKTLTLTHLRNSYYIYDIQDIYRYFLDDIKGPSYLGNFDYSRENDFRLFKQCMFKSVQSHNNKSNVDYLSSQLYDPDKAMVKFRVNFLPYDKDTNPLQYKHNFDYFDDSYFENGKIPYADKLIKDFAYILFSVCKHIDKDFFDDDNLDMI